jgi:hypothetical protein
MYFFRIVRFVFRLITISSTVCPDFSRTVMMDASPKGISEALTNGFEGDAKR